MKRPKWLRRRQRQLYPELPPPTGPLREFVYLDEVSVISLVASRRGAVPEAVTRSESARDSAEITSKIAANAAVTKAEVGGKLAAESTRGVTTVAKSVVQATFKDLREIESETLKLQVPPGTDVPNFPSPEELARVVAKDNGGTWAIAPASLRRGDPIEVRVELNTDPLFRVGTAISEGLLLLGDIRESAGISEGQFAEMQQMSQLLERLLVGLVPLRGRITDHVLVTVEGTDLVIHRQLADSLDLLARDLHLVGVASRALFWKDLRQVLFSGATYTVFGRMARTDVQQRWNPVKLTETMSEIAPDLNRQLEEFVIHAQDAVRARRQGEQAAGTPESVMRDALILHAQKAAPNMSPDEVTGDLEAAGLVGEEQLAKHIDVEGRREAFAAVSTHLVLSLSPRQALDFRTEALNEARSDGGASDDMDEDVPSHVPTEAALIEVEPVAIYW